LAYFARVTLGVKKATEFLKLFGELTQVSTSGNESCGNDKKW